MKTKFISLSFLALGMLISCNKTNNDQTNQNKEVPVLKITQKDTLVSNNYVADIQAKKNIEIRARIAGIIEHIYVNEGQFVKKGQPLFKTNDAELKMDLSKANASLKQADADIKIAEIEVNQLQSLFNKDFIASNELDLAKAKLASVRAKKNYVEAERNAINQKIAFTNITAPFDGVIDIIPFKEGSLVENGVLLTTISQLNEVYAYFSIPESLYFELTSNGKLGNHQKIELLLPNNIKYDFSGTLKTAEGEIDPETGSIRYKVLFPNPERLIKHGTSGKLVISESKNGAIIIPQKATFSIQDKVYAFVVTTDQKVKMTNITIDATLQDKYLVANGLKQGDVIVTEGTQSLRDGDKIQIKNNK
nr:efflux RND transporter periplasmic adaptor subunit [uncultured Flavobacterium sp.]